ncbi:MAG: phosphoribosyltransferase family protein [Aigarchaeota archaeon]|nr:phosphoribosyltransferase family protein [Aigarchaeota archaeon]MDW8092728.1 phosphoribosyltransferase family protein [Nitrososphaerota archaeon]
MRLFAVEALSVLRKVHDYKSLTKRLDISPSMISRYTHGKFLPNVERARRILSLLNSEALEKIVRPLIVRSEGDYYELSKIVSDVRLQRFIARLVCAEFADAEIEKVLTVATDGVPLAVLVADELGVDVVIAKGRKEPYISGYIEENLMRAPPIVEYLYIPRRSIKRGERVFIVDDILRSGKTIEALHRFVVRSGAELVGAFVIATIGRLRDKSNISFLRGRKLVTLVELT